MKTSVKSPLGPQWLPVTVKKRPIALVWGGQDAVNNEREALTAVKSALIGKAEPYHISYCLDTWKTEPDSECPQGCMYYISK